VELLV